MRYFHSISSGVANVSFYKTNTARHTHTAVTHTHTQTLHFALHLVFVSCVYLFMLLDLHVRAHHYMRFTSHFSHLHLTHTQLAHAHALFFTPCSPPPPPPSPSPPPSASTYAVLLSASISAAEGKYLSPFHSHPPAHRVPSLRYPPPLFST